MSGKTYKIFRHIINVMFIFSLMYLSAKKVGENKDKRIFRIKQAENMLSMVEGNVKLKDLLHINDESQIAVYGNSKFGQLVVKELIKERVHVSCIIDRLSCVNIFDNIPLCNSLKDLPSTDIILVTIADEYDMISQKLSGAVRCPIINIAEILR